ncbi:MAG: hypothetical protein JNK87_37865 [Bryobacterales bacterium]|nr:hypothetical protein [Bryobacterales bacterium]
MDPRAAVLLALAGAVALVLGLVPGLVAGVRVGIENFREELLHGLAARTRPMTGGETAERVEGLAITGVLLLGAGAVTWLLA